VQQDSTAPVSRWALTREYRVSYRDTLNPAETLLEGEWIGATEADGFSAAVPISISDDIVEELRLALGDTLEFDVQGVPMLTRVASIRKVDFQRPEPNFFVLFPSGVLEPAPQFFATTVFVEDQASKIALQSSIVSRFPNVSAIDISAVLVSVRTFLDKIAAAIQFMAGFSILTGVFVLAGALSSSRTQRIRESVLLRTLGASSRQIRWILILEVALVGFLAMSTGILLSLGAGWSLAVFFFKLPYVPDVGALTLVSFGLILMTGIVGWMGSRRIVSSSPLQILRSQAA
jgi:putative ABC transport system permease protein